MRSLDSNLTTAQNQMNGQIIVKIVLTSGATTYTYYAPGGSVLTNNIERVSHSETPWSQTATVRIDDSAQVLYALSLEGYTGTISYGYNVSGTDYYSAAAPLIVKGQEQVSSGGNLKCTLSLYGIPDQLDDDHASASYTLPDSDTQTVKTLINAIAGATMACFSHTTAITVDWDSEDSLIDTFAPKDYFRVSTGNTRLAKIKELLGYTKCVMRVEADGDIHIINPTVSGTTYAYEYNDIILAANHTFFSKVYRNRLVLPNKIVVQSSSDHAPAYTGNYTSAASFALLPKVDYKEGRLASDAQATAIATAGIQKLEVEHEKGNGFAPMNCGQEVHDYIKITDSRENDNRIGNVGYLTRIFDINNRNYPYTIGFGFGDISRAGTVGISPSADGTQRQFVSYEDFNRIIGNLQVTDDKIIKRLNELIMEDTVPKWHVTQLLQVPSAGV